MKAEQFTSVVSRLRPRLLAVAMQFDADEDAAEDAVQEALMRLWTAWEGLPQTPDAERLAVRLTKHACIDAYRQRQRRQTLSPMEASTSSADASLHETELQQALERAIDALTPSERRLWTMHTDAQMDRAGIAAATGLAVHSVSTILGAARRRLMEHLKKGGAL